MATHPRARFASAAGAAPNEPLAKLLYRLTSKRARRAATTWHSRMRSRWARRSSGRQRQGVKKSDALPDDRVGSRSAGQPACKANSRFFWLTASDILYASKIAVGFFDTRDRPMIRQRFINLNAKAHLRVGPKVARLVCV